MVVPTIFKSSAERTPQLSIFHFQFSTPPRFSHLITTPGEIFPKIAAVGAFSLGKSMIIYIFKECEKEVPAVKNCIIFCAAEFDTLAELERFKNDVKDTLSIDQRYDEVPSFNDTTAKYDEAFFAKNTLMLVYVEAGSGSFRFGVDSIYHADGCFCIHVTQTNNPEVVTDDMAGWFITAAVPDNTIQNCSEFDADLNNTGAR